MLKKKLVKFPKRSRHLGEAVYDMQIVIVRLRNERLPTEVN